MQLPDVAATLGRIEVVSSLEALAPAHVVVEAIIESLEPKRELFRSLESIEDLAAEPARYADALAREVPAAATIAELEARDAFLARAIEHIDSFIVPPALGHRAGALGGLALAADAAQLGSDHGLTPV